MFYYTQNICEYDEWHNEDILSRTQKLARLALKVWAIPIQYQKKERIIKASKGSTHTLGEDFNQFTNTNINTLLFDDVEYNISAWKKIMPIVFETLRKDNPFVLEKITNPKEIRIYHLDEDGSCQNNKKYLNVVKNIYVRSTQSTLAILNMMASLLKRYDTETGSDYFDSFLMEIK